MAKKNPTPKSSKPTTAAKTTVSKKSPPKKVAAPKKSAPKKVAAPKKSPQKPTIKSVVKKASPKKSSAKKPAAAVKAAPKATGKKSVSTAPKATKKESVAAVKAEPKAAKKTSKKAKAAAVKSPPAKAPEVKTSPESPTPSAAKKSSGRDALRSRILGKTKAPKSIAFSLDEVKEIAKTTQAKMAESSTKKASKAIDKTAEIEATLKAAKPAHVAAASLADILGFNPTSGKKINYNDPSKVPEKYRRYYKLLIELRTHLTGQIDQHSEETLKRSSKDDAGDLSSYGQHMADAGTDTFDRDFALSLVSNEQEALSEIEAAITRIQKGTYGICEVTGKPIDKERLLAVPFTRHSADAQKELERHRHRVRTQAGLLLDVGDDAAPMRDPSNDDD